MHASLHEAPAIQEGDLSTRTVRADASDAARVFFLQGWAAVARILYTDCYMRFSSDLPSIQPGYSDSSDTTCHVHGSATCVCNCLVPRVLSEGGGTSPSSDVRHELMLAFFVVFFRSSACRGTVVPRAVGPTQYCTPCGVAIWALPESCRRFLVDCVVFCKLVDVRDR